MKGKKEVIDILNEGLFHELAAVNQFWLHYRMLENWGYTLLAKKEHEESIEEMEHADKLVDRNLQTQAPLRNGQNNREVIEAHHAHEYDAQKLYVHGRQGCREAEDYVSMQLVEKLLEDEEDHIDFLETQLKLLKTIGEQNYGQRQSAPAPEANGKA